MRNKEPNWPLAFGSGSFLLVWLVGFSSGLSLETVAVRGLIGALLGAAVGFGVGHTLTGLKALKREVAKGQRIDFTLQGDEEEPLAPLGAEGPLAAAATAPAPPSEPDLNRTVPQAAPAPAASESFQPIDFKQAAKQVHGMIQEPR